MSFISKDKKINWYYFIGGIILTAIVFYPAIHNGFTNWDDEVYVVNNEQIREFSWNQIKYWFTAYHHGNYHPLTMISYMIEYTFDQLNPTVYHFTNYLLHLVNTGMVFLVVFNLFGRNDIACLTAILFGVHPMHVESVAWVSERKDLLYTAFYLWGLLVYLSYITSANWKRYLLLIVLFSGALLAKSAAVVFPVVLVLVDYLKDRKITKQVVFEKVPLFALSIIFGILAIKSQNATEAIADYEVFTTLQRFLFAGYGSVLYISKVFWPFGLTAFHPYPSLVDNGTRLPYVYYIAPVLSFLLFGGALLFWKRFKVIVFGLFFYLINVALVLQFVSVGSAIYSERYTYMAYIGLFIIIAYYLALLVEQRKKVRKPIYLLVAVICLFLSWLTIQQVQMWKDSLTLWQKFNQEYPECNHGDYKIAEHYMDAGENQKALDHFIMMTDKYSVVAKAYMGAGNMLGKMGKPQEALIYFNKAEERYIEGGSMENLWVNRAITYSMLKQYDKALKDYARALEYDPNSIRIYIDRGYSYLEYGSVEKAIDDFNNAIRLDPTNGRAYFMRALAYHRSNNIEMAILEYGNVLKLQPNNADVYHNRAICYETQKKYKEALADINMAKQLGKAENQAYINKLKVLSSQ